MAYRNPVIYKRSRFILLLLLCSIILLCLILEFYYQYGQCAVTEHYSKKNIQLTHKAIDMLADLSIIYWVDCQSLLNILRNETYNEWDQDVDLSIEWPLESNHVRSELNDINTFIKTLEGYNFKITYYPDRKFISLSYPNEMPAKKSHIDIWLWTRDHKSIEIVNIDFKYSTRLRSDIYPLKSVRWLGRNVSIPFQSHKLSYKEYGASYMTATIFRINCFHNFFNGRWI